MSETKPEVFSKEDGEKILKELDEVLTKYNAQIAVIPIINPNGTIGATANIVKKPIESPYTNGTGTKEEKAD